MEKKITVHCLAKHSLVLTFMCIGINSHVVAQNNLSSVCELNKQKGEDRTIKEA